MMKDNLVHIATSSVLLLIMITGVVGCEGADGQDEYDNQWSFEDETDVMDILWMISNTSRMCGSQQMLRDGADAFAEGLATSNIDFHVAVTTSHMEEASTVEPVAQPGRLQATPQPVPGYAPSCAFAPYNADDPEVQDPDGLVEVGDPNPARLDPVVAQIDAAIECTEEPEQWTHLRDFDEDQLRCALPARNECDEALHAPDDPYCTCPMGEEHGFENCLDCDALEQRAPIESFYPEPEAYRQLDVVLRATDYRDEDGQIDADELRADFRCMSMVGTRGDGYNRGLESINKAVSPQMTGGVYPEFEDALEVRDIYPNSGFLRDDGGDGDGGGDGGGGRTAILFASAANDCSHGGAMESTICGATECLIQEKRGSQGDLIPTDELASQFVQNVADSRGIENVEAVAQTTFPAAFLGQYQGLDGIEEALGEPVPIECSSSSPEWATSGSVAIPESCRSEQAVAWSGHRYTYFMEEFAWYYPQPESPGESASGGEMCNGFDGIIQEMFEPGIY